jgi:hypothetical protein
MYLSRPTHRLPRERPGEAASPRQRREFHRAVRRHPAVVEGLERRVAVQNRVAPRRGYMELGVGVNSTPRKPHERNSVAKFL